MPPAAPKKRVAKRSRLRSGDSARRETTRSGQPVRRLEIGPDNGEIRESFVPDDSRKLGRKSSTSLTIASCEFHDNEFVRICFEKGRVLFSCFD